MGQASSTVTWESGNRQNHYDVYFDIKKVNTLVSCTIHGSITQQLNSMVRVTFMAASQISAPMS